MCRDRFFQKLFVKRRAPKFDDMSAIALIGPLQGQTLADPGRPCGRPWQTLWQTLADPVADPVADPGRPWDPGSDPGRSWQIRSSRRPLGGPLGRPWQTLWRTLWETLADPGIQAQIGPQTSPKRSPDEPQTAP